EVVTNLCDNAVKYNVPGGSVRLEVKQDASRVQLTVEDTGIGIPPDDQMRVFERFYRVDKSHSRETGGTGLGLSIVKHIAAIHHAEIALRSAPKKGSCFTVTFGG
ncbi:MAG: ATP-binding protein, partial [Pyramidobacter sp.]|nr:ATP-binding protein [Pyramidobacter sp.]